MFAPNRYDWSQGPLLVTIRTLHEPSNGPAFAVEAKETVQAAKAVARVTARMDLLIMGDPRVGLVAPSPNRRRLIVVITPLFFVMGLALARLSISPGSAWLAEGARRMKGFCPASAAAQIGCESTHANAMLL
jgi:hypothetical protein